ncbi:hypothetical protein F4860DRAFT_512558 [Xylaria cubensis]|nr:hypothetical protein F4860DRAFT_512558 [Xylaria cubensis]
MPRPMLSEQRLLIIDLTQESKLVEFHITIILLRSISTPGNHEFILGVRGFRNKDKEACWLQGIEQQLIVRSYGEDGEARQLRPSKR